MPDSCPRVLGGGCRRGQPLDVVAAVFGERAEPLQHRGLAGAGVTLHADHAILRRQDMFDRFLLPLVEPAAVQPGCCDPRPHDPLTLALSGAHQVDGLRFPRQRLIGGPPHGGSAGAGQAHAGAVKGAVFGQVRDGLLGGLDRHGPRIAREHRREQIVVREHRLAFAQVVHRPLGGLRGGEIRVGEHVLLAPARLQSRRLSLGSRNQRSRRKVQVPGLLRPVAHEPGLVHVPLARPRHQRGAVRHTGVVARLAQAPFLHGRLDLGPSRGERLDYFTGHAGNLETAVRVGFLDVVPEALKPPGQFRPVDGADRHHAPVHAVVDHRAPLGIVALDHVRDDRVGMKLRVEVPGRVMGEGGRHHFLVALSHHRPGHRVHDAGFDGAVLDPVERALRGTTVGFHDPAVPAYQCRKGHRLRRGKCDVNAGTVMEFAVAVGLAQPPPVRHMAFQHLLKRLGLHRAGQAHRFGALAPPGAGVLVGGVVLRVVAVLLVIADALGGGGDGADGGYHRERPAPCRTGMSRGAERRTIGA